MGTWHQDRLADWPSVLTSLQLNQSQSATGRSVSQSATGRSVSQSVSYWMERQSVSYWTEHQSVRPRYWAELQEAIQWVLCDSSGNIHCRSWNLRTVSQQHHYVDCNCELLWNCNHKCCKRQLYYQLNVKQNPPLPPPPSIRENILWNVKFKVIPRFN
jgi:hypothetical protein